MARRPQGELDMPVVTIVDTCIFLNVLDVPAFNQHRDTILDELGRRITEGENLLLPFCAILEAGNHIAQLADGGNRRRYAEIFVTQVRAALEGATPWTPTHALTLEDLALWLGDYPDSAMREVGLGDLTIIREWEAACIRHPQYRVLIWSLDGGLTGYDRVI